MNKTRNVFGILFVVATLIVWTAPPLASAQNSGSAALAGLVSSDDEGPMEGVLVSAKRAGSTITTTVVSDAKGRYSFPNARLEPGTYAIRIRAVGYELGATSVDVAAQNTAQLDLKLRKVQDLSRQLSNGEWLLSMPGTEEQKQAFLGCVSCHTLERIVKSQHDAAEFVQVMQRMSGYAQGSTPTRPQLRPPRGAQGAGGGDMEAAPANNSQQGRFARQAEFAATVNLSSVNKWQYPLKTFPRPKGKATKVIITEYDLPRPEAMPHDAMIDSRGMVWYSDFGSLYLGKLDPRTGKAVEYPTPLLDPKEPKGALDVGEDPNGKIWLATMYQGVLLRFDPKTEKYETFKSPTFGQGDRARTAMVTPTRLNVDGKVWVGADDEYQVDVKSGEWTTIDYTKGLPKNFPTPVRLGSYGVAVDSKNNFYGMNLGGTYITRVDAKTMDVTPFATPTPNSGPRRGHMDPRDRLFFAEFRGNRIGMFDTKTEKFQEWLMPSPWTNPYDAILDKDGNAWTGGMSNDHIVRVNTKTNEATDYLLPRTTNVRRVNIDNSTNPPTFWVGNNLGASIIKLEPLE